MATIREPERAVDRCAKYYLMWQKVFCTFLLPNEKNKNKKKQTGYFQTAALVWVINLKSPAVKTGGGFGILTTNSERNKSSVLNVAICSLSRSERIFSIIYQKNNRFVERKNGSHAKTELFNRMKRQNNYPILHLEKIEFCVRNDRTFYEPELELDIAQA